jgi:hypothetical protein
MTSPTPLHTATVEPAERTLPGHQMRVTMADGTEFDVRITNRDRVAWDKTAPRHKWGNAGDVPFLASTFFAWSAAYREKLTDLKFEAFQEQCEDLNDVTDATDDIRPTR